MIGFLRGNILSKNEEHIVLDVSGVGYQVSVTSAVGSSGLNIGDELSLVIYTDVKETSISLYGFAEELERQVFLLLIKVKGIGSKLAMAILSALGPEQLLLNIGRADLTALTKVSGVGKKTAERLILELREQVGQLATDIAPIAARIERERIGSSTPPSAAAGAHRDAALALEKLGFASDRAERAVSEAISSLGAEVPIAKIDPGELLRLALAQL